MSDRAADAWLSEMWATCPELSIGERLAKRMEDRERRDEMLLRGIHTLSPVVDKSSTTNPETACGELSEGAA